MGFLGYLGAAIGIFFALIVIVIVGCLSIGGCSFHYHLGLDKHDHPHSDHHNDHPHSDHHLEGMTGGSM
jgi:hypothetical protein